VPGPLAGVRIVEISAIGPVPLAVMLLADLGADVIRVDRVSAALGRPGAEAANLGMARNRRSIALDLKSEEAQALVLRLVEDVDVLVEGFRPGVMERLGLGPGDLLEHNPRLVYARMTGWGQVGPLSATAGHDINFAALAGALHPIGPASGPPLPPLNLVADFGGGALYLALGIVAALVERTSSGRGQVVDAAMVDGAASLTAMVRGMLALGGWSDERGHNTFDGSHPYYRCYETADGKFLAVGPIEPQFWAAFLERLSLRAEDWPQQDTDRWEEFHAALEGIFTTRARDEWMEVFAGSDACVSPVLSLSEAPEHPANVARGVFVDVDGFQQPAPAPRLSRTPGAVRRGAPQFGEHTEEVLTELGLEADQIGALRSSGVIA
jgi:alpha-methylacyl-CoA racemase